MSCLGGSVSLEAKRSVLEDNTPLGAYLTSKELGELAKICVSAKVSPGKPVPESPFYVIISGQVEVRQGNDVLCTKFPGAFFTRRAGLVAQQVHRGTRRSAPASKGAESRSSIVKANDSPSSAEDSALAETPLTQMIGKMSGKLLCVQADKLIFYLENIASRESRDVINSITRTNIGTQLSQVPFIEQAALEAQELRSLGEICSYACYPEGKTVFKQGDPAENFYIILKGSVDVTIDVQKLRAVSSGSSGSQTKAVSRGVGDSFGVAALVYRAPERKYSVTASERTLCLVITKANFNKFLTAKPALEKTLMRSTKRFLLQRYSSMNVPIFDHIDEKLLSTAADLANFQSYEAGDVIYRQGDAPHAFYVVLHGEVKMSTVKGPKDANRRSDDEDAPGVDVNDDGSFSKEEKKVAESIKAEMADKVLSVGQHFGEVGVLLPQTPCIATCTAQTGCTLLVLESSAFIDLFGNDLNLLSEMQLKLLRHASTLRSCLNHRRCRPLFVKHIEGEYSAESIRFYDAVWDLKTAASKEGNAEEARKMAKELIKEYVLEGANQQVNIPGGLQKKIKDASDDSTTDFTDLMKLIKKAQDEIYVLMQRDNFPRFTKTQAFENLLKELGSYDEGVADLVSDNDLTMLVQDGEGHADEGATSSLYMMHKQNSDLAA